MNETSSREEGPKSETILVVEDHADTAEMLVLILESEGYRVRSASTAEAAFHQLTGPEAAQIGLILLDLTLPDMSGEDAIRSLRERRADIPPILIMSARSPASLEHAARSTGAKGIVQKPFDLETLMKEIRAATRKSLPARS